MTKVLRLKCPNKNENEQNVFIVYNFISRSRVVNVIVLGS